MPESQHPVLLNREQSAGFMAQHYTPQLDLLTQMVNYASNLMPRAFGSSEKQMADLMVCYGFLKQFATMLDAAEVLLRAGSAHAAFVPLRVAFEASLYLEWLLVSDGEKKAKHYFVGEIRKERTWGLRAQRAPSESVFLSDMGELGADIIGKRPELVADGVRHVADCDRILALPEYVSVNAAFEAVKSKDRRHHEPSWYKVLGKVSIAAIGKELHRAPEYTIYYTQASQVVHSSSYKNQMTFSGKNKSRDSGVSASPIRNLADAHTAFNYAFTTAMHVFHRVIAFYRPDELLAHSTKYVTEWREAFVNIPQIVVKAAD